MFFFLTLCLAMTLFGQAPRKLSYQGLLTDSTGIPLADGSYELTFKIYNLPNGGTLRHTETFSDVPVEKGTFNVMLGSITPFALAFEFTESLYVEVTIDNGPASTTYPVTFSTRTELTAAPYALGPWGINGDKLFYYSNVGIGMNNPSTTLEVEGTITTENLITDVLQVRPGAANGYILQSDSIGNASWVSTASLSVAQDTLSIVQDADGNTKIEVEQSANEDKIHFTLGGTEYFSMKKATIEVNNTNGSIFYGTGAGLNDDLSVSGNNTAIGTDALKQNITGNYNVAVGSGSLKNSTAHYNTGVGTRALENTSDGHDNVAVGGYSLNANISGTQNVAVGTNAGRNSNGSNNLFLGNAAGYNATGDNQLYIANTSTSTPLIYGDFSTNHLTINDSLTSKYFQMTNGATNGYVLSSDSGGNATWVSAASLSGTGDNLGNHTATQNLRLNGNNLSYDGSDNGIFLDPSNKVGIGIVSPTEKLDVNGTTKTTNLQMTNGATSGFVLQSDTNGNASWVNPTTLNASTDTLSLIQDADKNTKIEVEQTANENTIHFTLGGTEYYQMNKATLAFNNSGGSVFIGNAAGSSDDYDASYNTAIGSNTLQYNIGGNYQVAVGRRALQNLIAGNSNVAIGVDALRNSTSTNSTTAIGYSAGYTGAGSYNTLIGFESGYLATGNSNVFLGHHAGYNETGNHKLYIENSNSSSPLIYGDFSTNKVTVNDSLASKYFQMTNGATNGYVLKSDASGNASWVNSTTLSVTGDNLGNHTATQNVKMNGNWLSNDGGSEGMYVDTTGKVGLGTASPSAFFHLMNNSSGDTTGIRLSTDNGAKNAVMFIDSNGDYHLRKASHSTTLVLDDGGSVGFGTTSPASYVDINGGVGMKIKTSLVAGINNPDNSAVTWFYSSGTGTITLPTASTCTNRMYVIVNQSGTERTISSYKDLSGTNQSSIGNNTSLWIVSDGTNWLQAK